MESTCNGHEAAPAGGAGIWNGHPGGAPFAAEREQLSDLALGFRAMHYRLLGVHTSLPVSPREEAMLAGEAEPDFACEVRGVIECLLADHIEPAIRMLTEAAAYAEPEPERG